MTEVELNVRKMKPPKTKTKDGVTESIGQDTECKDCGADLQAGVGEPYHLVCARIMPYVYLKELTLPKVKQNEVIECNNFLPPEPELREVIPNPSTGF